MTEEKEKARENDKPRVFLKKGLCGGGGGKGAKHLSNCRKPFLCISYDSTPFEKKQNCRENGVCCHNLKAKQQTQTKKGKSTKKRNKQHNNNQDSNNRQNQEAQNAKKLGLEKGCDGTGLKGKQQNSRKVERRRKRIGQRQQN